MHPRRIEHQPDVTAGDRKSGGHARGNLHAANAHPREADTTEIVDALDLRPEQARRGRRNMDEFGTNADFDCRACGLCVDACPEKAISLVTFDLL